MSDQFIGEIRVFAFGFVPQGWAYCYGQQVNFQQYQALAAVIYNLYGPTNNNTVITLPDLRGRALAGAGTLTGVTQTPVAATLGVPTVTLSLSQVPPHTHVAYSSGVGSSPTNTPSAQVLPSVTRLGTNTIYDAWSVPDATPTTTFGNVLAPSGGGTNGFAEAHDNCSPYLAMNIFIALEGIFPVRQ